MVKMSASSKKIKLDENCGFQAKDFTSDRALQNHYRDHSRLLNKRGSDLVTEAAHQPLHRRMTMSNYFVRKVGTEAEGRKLFKAVVHTNAYNM